jgi:hypothetical protein
MVYCTKCGAKNDEGVEYCIKCGANLWVSQEKRFERRVEEWGEDFGRRVEAWSEQFGRRGQEECFGLPHGGAIVGLIIGAIILLLGVSLLLGIEIWDYLWALIIIAIGILILAGAIYGLRRRS